jgi:ketosteroid isomerase-like protein
MTPTEVAHKFVDAINSRDPENLYALMTDDHLFIDGMGERVQGRERMRDGWRGYYTMVPDYGIEVTETFESGNVIAMLGMAFGTFSTDGNLKKENFWKVPAAWRAVIDGNSVREWQVFADNEPIRAIMRREGAL